MEEKRKRENKNKKTSAPGTPAADNPGAPHPILRKGELS